MPSGAWNQVQLDSVDSTNEYVKRNMQDLVDRTAVVADVQTAGKGRLGRAWASPIGGLYASLLLRPSPPPEYSPGVGLLVADLICCILADTGVSAELKWPNDVIVRGRKLAGVLAESFFGHGGYGSWLIVGIGANLSVVPDLPDTRGLLPTSLAEHDPSPGMAARNFLGILLERLDAVWPDRNSNPVGERCASMSRRLWKRGVIVKVQQGDLTHTGSIVGVDRRGRLELATPGGLKQLESGELRPL